MGRPAPVAECPQEQSIFFRLPIELRLSIYHFASVGDEVVYSFTGFFPKLTSKKARRGCRTTDIYSPENPASRRTVSDKRIDAAIAAMFREHIERAKLPLSLTCQRIRREVEPRASRKIRVRFGFERALNALHRIGTTFITAVPYQPHLIKDLVLDWDLRSMQAPRFMSDMTHLLAEAKNIQRVELNITYNTLERILVDMDVVESDRLIFHQDVVETWISGPLLTTLHFPFPSFVQYLKTLKHLTHLQISADHYADALIAGLRREEFITSREVLIQASASAGES